MDFSLSCKWRNTIFHLILEFPLAFNYLQIISHLDFNDIIIIIIFQSWAKSANKTASVIWILRKWTE
jgi:hypothetical protein